MHHLVIRFSALGDVALTIPVFKTLEKELPNQKFYFLTRPTFKDLFFDCKNVEVISADVDNEFEGLNGLNKLANLLSKYQFDKVFDLHNVLRTKVLRKLLSAKLNKEIIVFDKGRKQKKEKIRNKETFPYLKHTTKRYLDTFKVLGVKSREIIDGPHIKITTALNSAINGNILDITKKWIGIAPFSKHKSKEWSFSKIYELIDYLENEKSYEIFLFAFGQNEKNRAKEIIKNFKVHLIDENSTILEQLNLMKHLDLMISMDSANMHLASLVGTKVVSIWLSTHPSIGFGPINNSNQVIQAPKKLHKYLPLSIYGKIKKKDRSIVEQIKSSITVEDVVKKIDMVLKNN